MRRTFFLFSGKTAGAASNSAETGFTLLELIVVMVLISLTATFTLPKIQSSLYPDELQAAARRFVDMVTETGQEARSKKTALEIRFDTADNMFTVMPAASEAADAAELRLSLATEEDREKLNLKLKMGLDESVQMTGIRTVHGQSDADASVIRFSSRGYTDKTAVHFRDDNGDELSVMISPFLGATRVLEGYVSLEDDRITLPR